MYSWRFESRTSGVRVTIRRNCLKSLNMWYTLCISGSSPIQNPLSWWISDPVQSKSAWTGLDYESSGLIQSIPYSGVVTFNSSRPEYQHIRGFDDPKKGRDAVGSKLLRCKPNGVHPGPHGSKTVQDFLHEKMPMFFLKNIRPYCSSNMYSCDFWLWGVFREKTNAAIHHIIDPLKTSIRKPLKSNMPEEARVTCAAFSGQFNRMNVVYLGYIEWNETSGTHECTYKKSARYLWNWRWYGTRKNDTEKSRFICPALFIVFFCRYDIKIIHCKKRWWFFALLNKM